MRTQFLKLLFVHVILFHISVHKYGRDRNTYHFFYICKHGYNNEAVSRTIKHFRDKQNRFTKHKLTIGSKSGIPQ